VYCVHDLHRRLLKGLQGLVRGNYDGLRESRYQVPSAHLHGHQLRTAVRRADIDLDLLGSPLTDQKIVLLSHITHQGLIEIVSGSLDGGAYYGASQGDHRDIRSTASDIDDHVSAGLGNIDARSNGRRHRLLNDADLSGASLVGGVLNGLSLNLCGSAGDADCDPGLS